jgi:oligopeptide transport system ATP-binding protein
MTVLTDPTQGPAGQRDGSVLVEARGLTKTFIRHKGLPLIGQREEVRAVDGINLKIRRGETLGLVGESGSGKSTMGRVILDLARKTSGQVLFDGQDLDKVSASEMRLLRRKMQIVFQDPYSSLHPRMTVRQTIKEGLLAGGRDKGAAADRRAEELLHAVGLGPAHLDVHPHRLSGGQRQRVAIARALSVNPTFIVADEPVSALDVSIQAQILNLLADIQKDFGLTYLFISHDLNVIRYLSDRVAVMYRGRIVEQAPAREFFQAPKHPYSRLLLSAMPKSVHAAPPSLGPPGDPQVGPNACRFHSRCPLGIERCRDSQPPLVQVNPEHEVACFRPDGVAAAPSQGQSAAPANVVRIHQRATGF